MVVVVACAGQCFRLNASLPLSLFLSTPGETLVAPECERSAAGTKLAHWGIPLQPWLWDQCHLLQPPHSGTGTIQYVSKSEVNRATMSTLMMCLNDLPLVILGHGLTCSKMME